MLGLELLVASHLFIQAATGPDACPAQKSARVDVRWRSEPIKYDFTKSIDTLNHSDVDTKNPYGTHVTTDVGGLMSGSIKYKSGIQISSIRYPASKVACLWIDKITIDVIIDPKIMVAREHAQGTCKHNAILEHEYKHVAVDRAVVKKYLSNIRQAATQAVQKVGVVGPKPDEQSDGFKKKMSDYIEAQVKVVMDKMYAERKGKQASVDTKKEYDRVQAQCEKK